MKSILYTIGIALIALALNSCSFNSVRGSGTLVSNEVSIPDYKGIDFGGGATMVYEQKPGSPYLRIETDDNIYPLLRVEVRDGTLYIGSSENINPTKFNIYTNSSTLEYLGASGSIKAILKGKLETSFLDIDVSGSGNITAEELICGTLRTKVSGSGDFFVTGKASSVDSRISGSGKVMATELIADTVSCSVSGSGDFFVTAQKYLNVSISGSGSVKYKGNPQIDQSISGSGRISRLE
ncbi:head GIN domain-containing protein [Dysgonomonas reticulitermitis]